MEGAKSITEQALVSKGPAVVAGVLTKAINVPAWGKVAVDMAHVADRHMAGGKLTAGRDVFPSVMSEKAVLSAIRQAYESGQKMAVQGDRVLLRGVGAGMTIEMWFNKATKLMETAYPK